MQTRELQNINCLCLNFFQSLPLDPSVCPIETIGPNKMIFK